MKTLVLASSLHLAPLEVEPPTNRSQVEPGNEKTRSGGTWEREAVEPGNEKNEKRKRWNLGTRRRWYAKQIAELLW